MALSGSSLEQAAHTHVLPSPSGISCGGVAEVTAGLAESNGSLLPGLWRDLLHVIGGLTACLYAGISSGPNARHRVWESFTFLHFNLIFSSPIVYIIHHVPMVVTAGYRPTNFKLIAVTKIFVTG